MNALPAADVLALLQAGDRTLFGRHGGMSAESAAELVGKRSAHPLELMTSCTRSELGYFPQRPDPEEAAKLGTRGGTLRDLAVTGGIITAAGFVLAGTFAALAEQKTVEVTEVGIAVVPGVLPGTLLVRTMLVPATLLAPDERAWWPARRGGRRPKRGDGS